MTRHSPLGASGAERWMHCPGSVRLLQHLNLDESDEEDYRTEGVAMHALGADCLNTDRDAWETVGEQHGDPAIVITPELADPVQIYLDHCRAIEARSQQRFVEYAISAPVHPLFYGTLDHGATGIKPRGLTLDITDLKGGAGIMVDVEENPQLKYYAFGLVDGIERQTGRQFDDTNEVNLHIVQPRISYADPVRSWSTSVGHIKHWVHGVLVPAMKETELNDGLDAGPWCRFCPAKLVCPLLTAMFEAACKANPKHVEGMSVQRLALEYQGWEAVKMYGRAVEKETFRQLSRGETDPRVKLVKKKANRAWRPGAEDATKTKFGAEAMTTPSLKPPAQIEKLPGGPQWVSGNAFTPDTGLTVALATEPGTAVKVPKPAERFSGVQEMLAASVEQLAPAEETW